MTTKQILENWTVNIEKKLIDNYDKKNIRASGKFADTINHKITDNSTSIYVNKYIGASIYGRSPNKDQSKEALSKWVGWFGKNVFEQWCIDKGIDKTFAYAIAWKVARKGWSEPNGYGNDGKLFLDTFNQEAIDDLKNELGKQTLLTLKSNIQETWQQSL
jgi:hypothetical protein